MKLRTSLAAGLLAAAAVTTVAIGDATPALAAGHLPARAVSTSVTKPVYKVRHNPTITGRARVGRILTAHITGVPDNAVVKYQWGYSGGNYGGGIGRATTKTTLKVPKNMRGMRLEVFAYVTVPGYSTGTARSALTAVVK